MPTGVRKTLQQFLESRDAVACLIDPVLNRKKHARAPGLLEKAQPDFCRLHAQREHVVDDVSISASISKLGDQVVVRAGRHLREEI
jgi:hypothetical protein